MAALAADATGQLRDTALALHDVREPRPQVGPLNLDDDKVFALVLLVVMLLVTAMITNLTRSSSGRQMFALRASEPAAAGSGISPTLVKLRIFTISAAIAGAGGVLLVTADRHATNVTYVTQVGLVWLASAVLMGVSRPSGAIVAGITAAAFPAVLDHGIFLGPIAWAGTDSTWLPQLLFGLGAIAMAQHPDGIMGSRKPRTRRAGGSFAKAPVATEVVVPQTRVGTRTVEATETFTNTLAPTAAEDADGDLKVSGVTAGYGGHDVLRDVTLRLERGTITALVGANGAGKSTLCKTVAGLLAPSAGAIALGRTDLMGRPAH